MEGNFPSRSGKFPEALLPIPIEFGLQEVVPFRSSKLTFLLRDSLAGNSKSRMVPRWLDPSVDGDPPSGWSVESGGWVGFYRFVFFFRLVSVCVFFFSGKCRRFLVFLVWVFVTFFFFSMFSGFGLGKKKQFLSTFRAVFRSFFLLGR